MATVNLICPHCGNESDENESDVEQDDTIACDACGELSVFWNDGLVTVDDAHEYRCDSLASRDYEDRAYGRPDE